MRSISVVIPDLNEGRGLRATALSIVMPVYNESATIVRAVNRVLAVDYPCPMELIVVDDGSTDTTLELLRPFTDLGVTTVCHPTNRGKGAAVRNGVRRSTGTHVIILDADLEYSPSDIPGLLIPVLNGVTDHVFGTRVFGLNTRFPSYRFAKGGRFTTAVANVLFDSCITDMHTCLKLIPAKHFRALTLSEKGFGLDTELTAKMLRAGVRPYEVPVSYYGRTCGEGKKITWRDGVQCLWILVVVRLRKPDKLPAATDESVGVVVPLPAASVPTPAPRLFERPEVQIANAAR
jgi:glycosyltransferase involved in cell wall biosynthesis